MPVISPLIAKYLFLLAASVHCEPAGRDTNRSVKLAMGSKIDIQLCIGRHSLRISSYEIDIQLCIQQIIRGI